MQIDLLIELESTLPVNLLKKFYISRLEQFPTEENSRLNEVSNKRISQLNRDCRPFHHLML